MKNNLPFALIIFSGVIITSLLLMGHLDTGADTETIRVTESSIKSAIYFRERVNDIVIN